MEEVVFTLLPMIVNLMTREEIFINNFVSIRQKELHGLLFREEIIMKHKKYLIVLGMITKTVLEIYRKIFGLATILFTCMWF
jgi:hypothetical protein